MWEDLSTCGTLVLAYLVGAVPFSNLIARWRYGQDLRRIGTGTSTPTNLYLGFGPQPAVVAGALEFGKGAIATALPSSGHPALAVTAGALAVTGHNWSVFLRGRGGRGISTATGALVILAWPGAVLLAACLAAGLTTRRVVVSVSLAVVLLTPVLALIEGSRGLLVGGLLVAPIIIKTVDEFHRRRRLPHLCRRTRQRPADGRARGDR